MAMSTSSSKTKQNGIELLVLRREDMRRLPRPHGGYEKFVDPLSDLVREYPELISRDGIDLDGLKTSVETAQALEAPCARAAQQLELLENTRFYHASNGWSQVLLMYDRAKSAARTNPAIARALEAFEVFLKHKKKLVTPMPAAPSSTP
jgi:hypothetical protein